MLNTFEINNRRYLGNKFRLLPFIREVVDMHCPNTNSFFDVFSGTGSVSSAFVDKRLVVNDLMYCNYLVAVAWFSPEQVDEKKVKKIMEKYNDFDASNEDNYMSQNFANTYFSEYDCKKIGFIRDDVEDLFASHQINERERAIIITSLIYGMDRIAKTCGHYDSFIQGSVYDTSLELRYPIICHNLNPNNQCFNADCNAIAEQVHCDVVYMDPPYNSRQYCDAYHLLENVALWDKPEVIGVGRKMDRTTMKSQYCRSTANVALEDLVGKLDCRYILLSYNNNGNKLQIRSNAKISDDEIIRILSTRGEVQVFTKDFRPFSAGKGENEGNQERLFLCVVQR